MHHLIATKIKLVYNLTKIPSKLSASVVRKANADLRYGFSIYKNVIKQSLQLTQEAFLNIVMDPLHPSVKLVLVAFCWG